MLLPSLSFSLDGSYFAYVYVLSAIMLCQVIFHYYLLLIVHTFPFSGHILRSLVVGAVAEFIKACVLPVSCRNPF